MTTLYRPDVLRVVDEVFDDQPVVLTIGGVIREMLALVGRKPNHLYSLDAMGQTVAIGLGLALGLEKESRRRYLTAEELADDLHRYVVGEPIYAKPAESAIRVLVRATKASRAPLQLLPGLVLHDQSGRATAAADAILRAGEALPLAQI